MAIEGFCQYRCHAGFENIKSGSRFNLPGYPMKKKRGMDFIEHTINWCTGEIFEGKMVPLFGIAVRIISIMFWKIWATPFAKAIVIPLLTLNPDGVIIHGNCNRWCRCIGIHLQWSFFGKRV
jgi:hypothetical protein